MTVATIPAGLAGMMPEYSGAGFGQNNFTNLYPTAFTFDAGTDEFSLVMRVPQTGTLTALEFHTGTVSTAGADFLMGLFTVDGTTGLPTTTPYVANSTGTVTVGTGDDNVWKSVAINSGTGVTVTKGDLVAVCLRVDSGTPNTVIISGPTSLFGQLGTGQYRCENTTGSLAKVTNSIACPFLWNYGGTYVYARGCVAPSAGNYQTPGNGAERGLRFSLPVPMRVAGCYIGIGNMAAGADWEVRLYSGSAPYTTEVGPLAVDGEYVQAATADGLFYFPFPASEQLAANTEYFLAVKQTTANVVQTIEWTVASSGYLAAMPAGAQFYLANRDATAVTNNTAFTETDTVWPMFFLDVDGLDDGAGGSGGGLRLAGHGGLAA